MKRLVVANWKANKTIKEAKEWLDVYEKNVASFPLPATGGVEVAIAPPYTLLPQLGVHIASDTHLLTPILAAQDLSMFPSGAYTGETTGAMLAELGVKHCLIGHSERRSFFGETTETVGKKLDQAIENGVTPIVCAQTLDEIPNTIRNYSTDKYVIMYEPARAISTAGSYHPEDPVSIEEVLKLWGEALPPGVRFLYGGSVNGENCSGIIAKCLLVSGFVVGHASLEANSFFNIIKQCL